MTKNLAVSSPMKWASGRRLQIIAVLTRIAEAHRGPCLVVCPATICENWRRELLRFAPSLRVALHRGPHRTGFPKTLEAADVTVTSYDTATRDLGLLCLVPWHAVILDEAQAIKNPDARRSKALKGLPRRCAIAVTGTPVENRLGDAWSLCDFVMPGDLGSLGGFEGSFDDTVSAAAQLEPLISPLLLRRRVRNVASDLPALIDTPEAIELDERAAQRYRQLLEDARARFKGAFDLGVLMALRQFCAHPFLIDGANGDPAEASTKYRRLLELLQEIIDCGEKVLVFCGFRAMIDLVAADFTRRGLPANWIDGRVPVQMRQPIIDRFSAAEGAAALVLNPRAAAPV